MQPDWPQWLIITAIFGMSKSKTAMASSRLLFPNFLHNQMRAMMSSPNYIQTISVARENLPVAHSQSV